MAQIFCPFCGAKNEESAAKCFICEKPFPWVGWSGSKSAGGHDMIAGGRVRVEEGGVAMEKAAVRIKDRLLKSLGVETSSPKALVA